MVTTEFGPFTLGLRSVLRGDATALESAIDGNTVAVLLELISRETGVLITPGDYPRALREITAHHNVLVTADEFQSGLGCTGTPLPCDTVGVVLDSACPTLHARWRSARWRSTRTTRRTRNLCNAIGRHRPVLEGGHGDRVYRWRATVGLNCERTGFGRSALCLP